MNRVSDCSGPVAVLCFALCLSPAAMAQSEEAGDTVVVTAGPAPLAEAKVGQAITLIPSALIEDQGYVYVSDALRQVPGAAVSRLGAPGGLTQVRMRGSEANHTLVLIDGVDISSPDTGETDLSILAAAGLDRIEVLRGPQSGLYGSNALAGVINLVSRDDLDGYYLSSSLEAGAFGSRAFDAGAGAGDGETFMTMSLSHVHSEGYDISADQSASGVPAVGAGARAGDREGHDLTTLSLRGGLSVSDTLRVRGFLRQVRASSRLDGQAYSYPIAGRTYDDASGTRSDQLLAGASATFDPFGGIWESTLSLSRLQDERRSWLTDFPFLSAPPVPAAGDLLAVPVTDSGSRSSRLRLGAQSTITMGQAPFASFLTGFAEQEEERYSDSFSPRSESRRLTAFGLHYRAEIDSQLFLAATLRRDQNDRFRNADTWSASLSWTPAAWDTRLHASAGTGVTNPTFVEQFGFNPSTFIGNASLAPEEGRGWDAGVEQTLFGGGLVIDATYFTSRLRNEIYTAFLPDFRTTALNATSLSRRSGWELSLAAEAGEDVSVYASYTQTHAREPSGPETRRPERTASLDASWRPAGAGLQLNLGASYQGGAIDTDFGTFMRTPVKDYTLVRVGLSYAISDTIELYGRIENLLDEAYEDVIGYSGAPRAGYVGIRFRREATP